MKKIELLNSVTRSFHKVGFQLKKHSPEILVVAGVIGTVASAVMACKATTKVNAILDLSDEMLLAYVLKEKFYKLMTCKNRDEAKKIMSEWILMAQNSKIPEYTDCAATLTNWSVGILNSFDVPYSNGFTEGCNNKIKVLKRNAYGYRNFKRFRNRILHMFSDKKAS